MFSEEWNAAGGVLLLGYEMYRLLSNKRSYMIKPKKKKKAGAGKDHHPDIIDVEEDSKNEILMTGKHSLTCDMDQVTPGTGLVNQCENKNKSKSQYSIKHVQLCVLTRSDYAACFITCDDEAACLSTAVRIVWLHASPSEIGSMFYQR